MNNNRKGKHKTALFLKKLFDFFPIFTLRFFEYLLLLSVDSVKPQSEMMNGHHGYQKEKNELSADEPEENHTCGKKIIFFCLFRHKQVKNYANRQEKIQVCI